MSSHKHTIIDIDHFKYAVFEMKYFYNSNNGSFIIGNHENCKIAKVFIVVPSWMDIQDLRQRSAEINIVTGQYEINMDKMDNNKILYLCNKIIDQNGEVSIMNEKFLDSLNLELAYYLLHLVDFTINEYYAGSEMTVEKRKDLSKRCFDFYTAQNKKRMGQRVPIPPCPGIVLLLSICDNFNCTPDVARKISYADIEMMYIAREQEKMSRMML